MALCNVKVVQHLVVLLLQIIVLAVLLVLVRVLVQLWWLLVPAPRPGPASVLPLFERCHEFCTARNTKTWDKTVTV
jgi:hypothetical protein